MEYKLEIYAPESEIVNIRDALISVGAGVVDQYDSVVSVVNISGFWRPLEKSKPVNGLRGVINFGKEVRIDVRCKEEIIQKALNFVKEIHPYEEPMINVLPLANHKFA